MFSVNKTAGTGIVTPNTVSIGTARDPQLQRSIWAEAKDVDPSDTNSHTSTTDLITLASSPGIVNAQANLLSFDADGFTLSWPIADSTARQVLYWAVR